MPKLSLIQHRQQEYSRIPRLGRKKENGHTNVMPRPMLVSMSSQDVIKKIMRNQHNLRSRNSNISMNHDITNTVRERTKNLVDKAREINEQEHLGEWFYEVRAPPWENILLTIRKVNLQ